MNNNGSESRIPQVQKKLVVVLVVLGAGGGQIAAIGASE